MGVVGFHMSLKGIVHGELNRGCIQEWTLTGVCGLVVSFQPLCTYMCLYNFFLIVGVNKGYMSDICLGLYIHPLLFIYVCMFVW